MKHGLVVVLTAAFCLAVPSLAQAQGALRDPTQVPPELRAPAPAASAAEGADTAALARQIMVVNGRPFLIVGGRRLGVGDKLGEARIERFDDGAVWLKEAGVSRRVSLYEGVVKRNATPPAPAAAKNPSLKKPSPRTATKNTDQEKP